jgi:hypothetical protein
VSEEQIKALREAVKNRLDDPIIVISYLEHQIDLQGKVLDLLASEVEASGVVLSTELKDLLQMQKDLLTHSSVDFDNLQDQMESYKIPKTAEKKSNTRKIQYRYLQRQIEEGIFGDQ